MNMEKQLPIGYDSFEKIISQNLYYVDKTLMIKELLDKKSHVNLLQDRAVLEKR